MLGHLRNIFRGINRMQSGEWVKNGGLQLSEKTIGIVGFGHIGTDLAELLGPFRCRLLVCDILDKSKDCARYGAKQVSYDELIQSADIVTFHVPGTPLTKNMLSSKEINAAKSSALVINTARGSIVDFDAITAAVKANRIAGYASDVFPKEPLSSKEYSIEQGFYFTPHIGGNADEAVLAMGRAAIRGLQDFWK